MLERIGSFLFRWRNGLFPLIILALAGFFPSQPISSPGELALLVVGLGIAAAGQVLRVLTIGWQYIERGGERGRVSATRLVTGGMFAHCRNPLYVGNVLLVAGFLIAFGRPLAAAIGFGICVFAYAAIVASEEAFLRRKFGEDFAAYCAAVPRWRLHLGGVLRTLRSEPANITAILLREYSTLSITALLATALAAWRLYEGYWNEAVFATVSVIAGVVLGFFCTIRLLKKKRIVYLPR